MPEKMTFAEFKRIYDEAVDLVLGRFTPQMQNEIALHNDGWRVGRMDLRRYLQASAERYFRAYCALQDGGARNVCDVGGMWGVFPLTLRRIGYPATMTEALRYYSQAFDEVFGLLSAEGVEIIDYDPFDPAAEPIGRFDFVSLMAVLEHYPHSPRHLLENVKRMLNPTGTCYIEVPNIAYWPKRIGLLFGETPLPDISEIYRSEVPFTGHHHEYTMRQLNEVTELAGLRITGRATYNYSIRSLSLRGAIRRPVVHFLGAIAYRLFPNTRELIAVRCRVSH